MQIMTKLKFSKTFLNLLTDPFFINFLKTFLRNFHLCTFIKWLKIYQPNIIKETKKDYKNKKKQKKVGKREKVTIGSWAIQKCIRRWKIKACWVYKKRLPHKKKTNIVTLMAYQVLLKKNIMIVLKIYFEAIKLLQKANFNKSLL